MFSEFANARHKAQAERFLLSLGMFVVEFERVCAGMRSLVLLVLERQGLNQGMAQVVIGRREGRDTTVRDMRDLFAALIGEMPGLDEDDRSEVAILMKSISALSSERNQLVHSDWHIGIEAVEEEELTAASFRFRATPSLGASLEQHWRSTADIEQSIVRAKECQCLLRRVQYCLNQSGFKIATELRKSL